MSSRYSSADGDILIYDQTQWVPWMSSSTYANRASWVEGLNFLGTSDWAIDLNQTYAGADSSNVVYVDPRIWEEPDPTVACYPPCTFVFPPWSLDSPTVISQSPVTMTMDETWPRGTLVNDGSTITEYISETTVTTISIPPKTTDRIPVWNSQWNGTDSGGIYITSSVVSPPMFLTEGPPPTQSSSTTTAVPFYYTYSPGPFPPETPAPSHLLLYRLPLQREAPAQSMSLLGLHLQRRARANLADLCAALIACRALHV